MFIVQIKSKEISYGDIYEEIRTQVHGGSRVEIITNVVYGVTRSYTEKRRIASTDQYFPSAIAPLLPTPPFIAPLAVLTLYS